MNYCPHLSLSGLMGSHEATIICVVNDLRVVDRVSL